MVGVVGRKAPIQVGTTETGIGEGFSRPCGTGPLSKPYPPLCGGLFSWRPSRDLPQCLYRRRRNSERLEGAWLVDQGLKSPLILSAIYRGYTGTKVPAFTRMSFSAPANLVKHFPANSLDTLASFACREPQALQGRVVFHQLTLEVKVQEARAEWANFLRLPGRLLS